MCCSHEDTSLALRCVRVRFRLSIHPGETFLCVAQKEKLCNFNHNTLLMFNSGVSATHDNEDDVKLLKPKSSETEQLLAKWEEQNGEGWLLDEGAQGTRNCSHQWFSNVSLPENIQ